MNLRALAASAALALLAVGCDADADPGSSHPEREASVSTGSVSVVVPDLTGQRSAAARGAMRDLGLVPRVIPGAMSACVPADTVVRQQPTVGTDIEPGARVRLFINVGRTGSCGLDLPPAAPDLRRIARSFVDFARATPGQRVGIPADNPVELFIGGFRQKQIPSGRLTRRAEWLSCPGGEVYASRGCPISVLKPLVNYPGPIAATGRAPSHPCLRGSALPDRLDAYRSVTLTPDEQRDCTSYFAVQLFVNDVDQVVAANLVVSEP